MDALWPIILEWYWARATYRNFDEITLPRYFTDLSVEYNSKDWKSHLCGRTGKCCIAHWMDVLSRQTPDLQKASNRSNSIHNLRTTSAMHHVL